TAINVLPSGEQLESEPVDVTLEVLPSIILRELQPLGADCDAPSKVLLGGLPYRVTAEAIGFSPVNFSYVMFGGPYADAPRIIRRQAATAVDRFGGGGEITFPEVPPDQPFYIATFAVTALDADGREHALA